MLYPEYKTAARKHLNTCNAILDSIDRLSRLDNNSPIVNIYKQETLHNIFYLAGYILEAISTYSIYRHYGWTATRNIKQLDRRFSNRCQFSFRSGDGYAYYAQWHQFQTNQFEVLKIPFSTSGIPFIDSSISVDLDVDTLFSSWKAEVRYHGPAHQYTTRNVQLNPRNVTKFVQATNVIYNSLLQIVG